MLWVHCGFLEIIVSNRLGWCLQELSLWYSQIRLLEKTSWLVCLLPRDRLVHTDQAIEVFPSVPRDTPKKMTIKINPTVHKWRYLINIYRNDYKYCTNLLLENILKNKWNVDDNLSFPFYCFWSIRLGWRGWGRDRGKSSSLIDQWAEWCIADSLVTISWSKTFWPFSW